MFWKRNKGFFYFYILDKKLLYKSQFLDYNNSITNGNNKLPNNFSKSQCAPCATNKVTTVVERLGSEKRCNDNKFKYGAVSPLAHTMRNSQIFKTSCSSSEERLLYKGRVVGSAPTRRTNLQPHSGTVAMLSAWIKFLSSDCRGCMLVKAVHKKPYRGYGLPLNFHEC